jgi:hypothetical protein
MTGLAVVMIVIGLGSVMFSSASRDEPVSAIGGSNQSVVANMTDGNLVQDRPVAELGVAPSTGTTETVNAAEIAKREAARRAAAAAGKK